MRGKGENSSKWALMLLLLMVSTVGMHALSESQCKEERRLAVNACKPVVYGRLPSPECCERARVTHVECVCPVITPKLAALIDVNRAIRLIQGCGRTVPRHFKCGSITTP
ncbi:uncharacterized protein LOC131229537 [Magnolia sinica]|uniref:uncharacterized protein LOC131229537 n=1 Tax=Magnolia sinica TaxID=86752 RepID=UPI0026593A56|nr:uncharacterized protein LOC131229537 [Magnolia sinica]